jgi:hypothetical protein
MTASPGYYPALQVVYEPEPSLCLPELPDHPGSEDIARAVNLLKEVIQDFPFIDEASRTNAIAALLTAVLRPAIPGPTPLALFDKPQSRTGASLLADLIARVATGRPAAMMTAPADEEEWAKTITALLLQGRSVVVIDNVIGRLYAPSLAAALTADTWRKRVLGVLTMVEIPARVTWMATGNNLEVGDEIAGRCYWIRMDAHMARPGARTNFLHPDLPAWVVQERGRILAAVLTLTRAWILAGRPKPTGIPQVGGFEKWRWFIGGILQNAGLKDFLGNLEQFHERSDINTRQWDSFLLSLQDHFPEGFTVKDVVTHLELERDPGQTSIADPETPLDEVLPDGIAGRNRDYRTVLGKAFSQREGRVFPSGVMLEKEIKRVHSAVRWKVKKVDKESGPGSFASP